MVIHVIINMYVYIIMNVYFVFLLHSCFARFNLLPEDGEESCDSHMTREFTISELCSIVSFLDFTDEVGR